MIYIFEEGVFFFLDFLFFLFVQYVQSSMSWQNLQEPLQICVSVDSDAPSKISVVPLSRGLKIENLAYDSDGSTMFSRDALMHAGPPEV